MFIYFPPPLAMVNKDVHRCFPPPQWLIKAMVNKDVHMLSPTRLPLAMVNKDVHMLPPTPGNG